MISKRYFLDKEHKNQWYCDNPELIENYDLAIADMKKVWICHHRFEEFYTMPELKAKGLYYKRPPEELIFVENTKEHMNLPHKEKGGLPKNRKDLSKPVLCVETGVVYPSIQEAERQTSIKNQNISNACNGKRKTAGKFHWRYV